MKQLRGDAWEFINRSKHGRCISSIPQLNGNSIEFFLSTQTRRVIKLFQAKSLQAESERMPVQKAWDHVIELKEGFVSKKEKSERRYKHL